MAKFNVGNTFKYNGDVYKVVGLDSWGYNVIAIEYTDFEDTKTHISYNAEILMIPYDMPQKYYPIFKIDVCFTSYAIDYILVGAKDVDDLIAHIKTVAIEGIELTDDYIYFFSNIKTDYDGRIEVMENSFTDKPYVVLGRFRYYE